MARQASILYFKQAHIAEDRTVSLMLEPVVLFNDALLEGGKRLALEVIGGILGVTGISTNVANRIGRSGGEALGDVFGRHRAINSRGFARRAVDLRLDGIDVIPGSPNLCGQHTGFSEGAPIVLNALGVVKPGEIHAQHKHAYHTGKQKELFCKATPLQPNPFSWTDDCSIVAIRPSRCDLTAVAKSQ